MISNSSAGNNTALVPDNDTSAATAATTDALLKAKAAATLSQNLKSDTDMEIESLEQQPTPPHNISSNSSPQAVSPLTSSVSSSSSPSHHTGASEPTPPSPIKEASIVPQKHQKYTIGELKNKLMEMTNVEPKRQKLMLVKGKLPEDHVVLSTLSLKNNQTFLMMGTPEAKVIKAPEVLPDVLNDLEEDYTPDDEAFANDAQNQKCLKSTVAKCDINIMNPLRPGKKLLVLDLDYTLIDCKALNSHMFDIMRPGLHDFLTVCYEHYDIVIWSQTSWRALEAKITTIGLLDHINYKIAFVMDISTMFSVLSQRDGKPFKHQVKALDIIWQKFPQFSARNTIHVDDLSRNFAMNPKSGLKIGAYKNGAVSRHTDKELVHLAKYLVEITNSNDFKELDHKNWKSHRKLNR
ncbi:hypothetical protein BGZ82_002468 [Podila clonocystis]|nr:hypothetical protein BGZ82_002468 [Podila clonocystis]